ncbi:MAG: xanthine dehydrogenase family protein molybdopterin-binding subunit [Halobacteriales archaeon]|nr:xanthine dehydrogenase family protein molybdopterin-binding subunit [Halobacteriales archaeon]
MAPEQFVGAPVERREDPALLTGRADYTDDLTTPEMTYLAIHRSQRAHADIEGIDVEEAAAMDGVIGVYTWADIERSDAPGVIAITAPQVDAAIPGHPILARDRVRYQGEPVAAVVAADRYTAADAADAIRVTYDGKPTVTDPAAATDTDAPELFEAAPDNIAVDHELGDPTGTDEAFENAEQVVDLSLRNNRLIPNAIEPRAALADYDPADRRLTVEMTSQSPHRHRTKLAATLGMPEQKLQVIAPTVGGGFGHKGHHHPGDALAAWCAIETDRPVKWTATRTENYLAGAHARDHATDASLAIDTDGTIRGLRVDATTNVGAYGLGYAPAIAASWGQLLAGQYAVPTLYCHTQAVFTNTAPVHSYRGAGRPEAIYVIERLLDNAARRLDIDPVTIRRQNQLRPDQFPHETPTGAVYDSGDYETALDAALETAEYDRLRERQRERRDAGELVGVGIANYVESTGAGFESGVVRVRPGGGVTVYAGSHSHGQGHETTYAQIVADELGVDPDSIEVIEGDTEQIPEGTGTFGSRSTVTGGGAVVESAKAVREKAERIAAHRLEADRADIEHGDGEFRVTGAPDRSISFGEVAGAAYSGDLPDGVERGLEETTFFEPDGTAYTFGTHVAAIVVDRATGEIEIERYVAVDDCGRRINPRIVDGQIHGGVAQGIGQALYEHGQYDDNGNLVTGSLQDYAIPKIGHLPEIETEATVTPAPGNPLGAKGIGEAGTIAAPPAVVNAVVDALAPLGVDHVDMPLTPERIWRAIEAASEE